MAREQYSPCAFEIQQECQAQGFGLCELRYQCFDQRLQNDGDLPLTIISQIFPTMTTEQAIAFRERRKENLKGYAEERLPFQQFIKRVLAVPGADNRQIFIRKAVSGILPENEPIDLSGLNK